ncbi:hypothetical protein ACQP00_25995 [Dactylosporangium sp. CS-047395]|uniref:hypothetical protein n=1 Tax=Dactylosporangium sp. CS-047395 TaxID=3239936 RepID=UPI003D94C995
MRATSRRRDGGMLVAILLFGLALFLACNGLWFGWHWASVESRADGICAAGSRLYAADNPWGRVTGCRVLDRSAYLYDGDDRDGSVTVLLDTDRGLAAIRVDYWEISVGHPRATAVELAVDDTPGLSEATVRRLRSDVIDRAGPRPEPWVIEG